MGSDLRGLIVLAIFYFCILSVPLEGQQQAGSTYREFEDLVGWSFGQDQELVNGMQYYNKHPRSLGHPYLLEGLSHPGSVTIRGRLYSRIWLKYDIHAQQVVVDYRTMNGAENQVILVSDRVEEFTIESDYFKKLTLVEDAGEQFYQVIGEGRLILYIQFGKILVPISGDSRFIEKFTPPRRTYFLELDGSVHPFQNKKSFIKLFPKAVQNDIKRFIRKNYIQIRSASPEQLRLFILAAGKLLEGVD